MKLLIVVNESPWGSGLALTAYRLARAATHLAGHECAVFFREDGIYNALPGQVTDAGTEDLALSWAALAESHDTRLLLCRSSTQRRLIDCPPAPFQESGLTEMLELMHTVDRVVAF
jgi:sulfur relay (sulfurtransferase) complex TusBCD TusD component (DsrE family)